MYVNRYKAPSGDEYEGCGRFNKQADAEECARQAVRYALQGTQWVGTRLYQELANAA